MDNENDDEFEQYVIAAIAKVFAFGFAVGAAVGSVGMWLWLS